MTFSIHSNEQAYNYPPNQHKNRSLHARLQSHIYVQKGPIVHEFKKIILKEQPELFYEQKLRLSSFLPHLETLYPQNPP
jgi:hypothetical protein